MPKKKKKDDKAAKIAEAIDYRLQGYSYDQIAEEMKLPRDDVIALVNEGLATLYRDPAKEAALLDLGRINQAMTNIVPNAIAGEASSIDLMLKLMKERNAVEAKLIGLVPKTDGLISLIKSDEPNKGGRPEHVPSPESRALVEGAAIGGVPHKTIAWRLGISEPTLRKHYDELLEMGKESFTAEACGMLAAGVRRGREASLFFYLKTQAGFRETHKFVGDNNGKDAPLIPPGTLAPAAMPLVEFIFTNEKPPEGQ